MSWNSYKWRLLAAPVSSLPSVGRTRPTVGAYDIPTSWREQLAPGGSSCRCGGAARPRSVAFVHDGDLLRSDGTDLCGFVPMIGQDGEHAGPIDADGHVTLHWDTDQSVDPAALRPALATGGTTTWSGITVGPYDPFDGIWLRLTATEPGTCRIAADHTAVATGLCTPVIPTRSPALVDGDSLAYLTARRTGNGRSELGATGHGPTGHHLAERLSTHIRTWDRDRTAQPVITAHPANAPASGLVIAKRQIRLVLAPPAS